MKPILALISAELFTPNLDQLASEGRLYKNCFSSATVCFLERSPLMIGPSQYPASLAILPRNRIYETPKKELRSTGPIRILSA